MAEFKEIEGSNVIVSGRKLVGLGGQEIRDVDIEKFISNLKKRNVKKVFMIFLGIELEKGYSKRKQDVESRLAREGIQFMPLLKEPKNIGPFETFSSSIKNLTFREKALVMCYHGMHNSEAYASYHLLKSGWTFERITAALKKHGLSEGSIATIKSTLQGAGVDVRKVSLNNERLIAMRAKNSGNGNKNVKKDPRLKKFGDFLHSFSRRK